MMMSDSLLLILVSDSPVNNAKTTIIKYIQKHYQENIASSDLKQ